MRVIVVGAGVVGSAIAWRLARCGAQVTCVDPDPGSGASRAAAGMLTPLGEAWHTETKLLEVLSDSAARYPGFIRDLEADAGRSAGYRETPTLMCGYDASDLAVLSELHTAMAERGLVAEELTVRQARRMEPALTPRLAGAFLAPDDHQVDPRTLVAALLAGFAARGGQLVRESVARVTRVGSDAGGWRVELATGADLTGDVVVLANALGASEFHPLLAVQRPVYGDILRLGPAMFGPPLLGGVIRGSVQGRAVYAVPRADGSLVLGATMREDDDARVSFGGVHALLRDAVTLLPGLVDLSFDETLARARPATPDNLPLLGVMEPGLIAAAGFFRHGVLLSAWAADAVAHLLDVGGGAVPGVELCHPRRFEQRVSSDFVSVQEVS